MVTHSRSRASHSYQHITHYHAFTSPLELTDSLAFQHWGRDPVQSGGRRAGGAWRGEIPVSDWPPQLTKGRAPTRSPLAPLPTNKYIIILTYWRCLSIYVLRGFLPGIIKWSCRLSRRFNFAPYCWRGLKAPPKPVWIAVASGFRCLSGKLWI